MEKKILIVEDEVRISTLLKMYLQRESFAVDIETDGAAGLEKALKQNFDLIILDVLMPGMDGFQVLEELRKVKNTPVFMLSAKGEENDIKHALELGANKYILKPFSCSDVVSNIKKLLN